MNKLIRLLPILIASTFITQNCLAYHVTVYNDTPLVIKAKCAKKGAIKVGWKTILPNQKEEVGCGGADCTTGVEVQVAYGEKTIKLETSWQLKCGNVSAHVVPIPTWDIKKSDDPFDQSVKYTLTGFKLAIGSSFEIEKDQPLIPYKEK